MSFDDGETERRVGVPDDPFQSGPAAPAAPGAAGGGFPMPPSTPSYPAAPLPGSATPAEAFTPPTPAFDAPPAGYVAYGSAPATPLESTTGLGKAATILFWLCVGTSVFSAIAMYSRQGTWDDYVAGNASFGDLDDADTFVAFAGLLSVALTVAAGIVVSIWSLRAARNFKTLGARDVSPGWTCAGWYVPIANLFVSFIQLRRGVRALGGDTSPLVVWQTLFVGSAVSGWVVSRAFDGNARFVSDQQVSDQLTTQAVAGIAQALLLAGAAFFAMRSIAAIGDRFAAASESPS